MNIRDRRKFSLLTEQCSLVDLLLRHHDCVSDFGHCRVRLVSDGNPVFFYIVRLEPLKVIFDTQSFEILHHLVPDVVVVDKPVDSGCPVQDVFPHIPLLDLLVHQLHGLMTEKLFVLECEHALNNLAG